MPNYIFGDRHVEMYVFWSMSNNLGVIFKIHNALKIISILISNLSNLSIKQKNPAKLIIFYISYAHRFHFDKIISF